jgi:hypothetical protein
MDQSEKLYTTAKSLLGYNLAKGNEMLGCAQSISAVINEAFPDDRVHFVGTGEVYDWCKKSDKWEQVDKPQAGDLIVSPTTMIPSGSPLEHGHVGIVGMIPSADGSVYIMSNNSLEGYFDTHTTLRKWLDYYHIYGQIPTFFFRRIA